MKKFMSLMATVAVIGLLCTVCLFSTSVLAQVVSVDAKATGEFGGHPDVSVPTVLHMVPGFVFSGPGTIRITASGTIDLNPDFPQFQNITPEGLGPLDRVTVLGAADRYMPLEEALVDAGGVLPSKFLDGGALMGAFVPQAIVDTSNFLAKDDDFVNGGISSDRLFFIGSGPFDFTTTIPGTLFLGINDVRATNNSGSFEVDNVKLISPTKTPPLAGVMLLLLDVLCPCWSDSLLLSDQTFKFCGPEGSSIFTATSNVSGSKYVVEDQTDGGNGWICGIKGGTTLGVFITNITPEEAAECVAAFERLNICAP